MSASSLSYIVGKLVRTSLEVALQLTTEVGSLFDEGNLDEKLLLGGMVFKYLYVDDEKSTKMEPNTPFNLITTKVDDLEPWRVD